MGEERKPKKVDLDAVHKARDEAEGVEAPEVTIGGVTYELPPSLPALCVVALGMVRNGDMAAMSDVIEGLFVGQGADDEERAAIVKAVLRGGFELEDVDRIFEGVYGDDSGEAPASAS